MISRIRPCPGSGPCAPIQPQPSPGRPLTVGPVETQGPVWRSLPPSKAQSPVLPWLRSCLPHPMASPEGSNTGAGGEGRTLRGQCSLARPGSLWFGLVWVWFGLVWFGVFFALGIKLKTSCLLAGLHPQYNQHFKSFIFAEKSKLKIQVKPLAVSLCIKQKGR